MGLSIPLHLKFAFNPDNKLCILHWTYTSVLKCFCKLLWRPVQMVAGEAMRELESGCSNTFHWLLCNHSCMCAAVWEEALWCNIRSPGLCQVADLNFSVVQQYKTNEKTSTPDHVFGGTDILTDLPDVKDQEPLLPAVFSSIICSASIQAYLVLLNETHGTKQCCYLTFWTSSI